MVEAALWFCVGVLGARWREDAGAGARTLALGAICFVIYFRGKIER